MTAAREHCALRDRRKPGHFWADNELFDIFAPRIGPHGMLVYIALARECFGNYSAEKVSLRRLAEMTGISKDSVRRALGVLLDVGLILESRGRRQTASSYDLVDVKELAQTVSPRDRFPAGAMAHPTPELSQGETKLSHPATPHIETILNTKNKPLTPLPPLRGENVQIAREGTAQVQNQEQKPPGNAKANPSLLNLKPEEQNRTRERELGLAKLGLTEIHAESPPSGATREKRASLSGRAAELALEWATERVMRECDFTQERLRPVISRALGAYLETSGESAEHAAMLAITNRRCYVADGRLLRFHWGPAKFFSEGHWCNPRGWPYDRDRVEHEREARLGT